MIISASKYSEILESMPICCVDIIIEHSGEFILIHRKQSEDFGGLWWIPGGRIHKNETWENAVRRKALEETGINVEVIKQGKSYEAFEKSHKAESGIHCITTVFVATPIDNNFVVKTDSTSTGYKWVKELDDNYYPLLRIMINENREHL